MQNSAANIQKGNMMIQMPHNKIIPGNNGPKSSK
jgi:hypothetical protein